MDFKQGVSKGMHKDNEVSFQPQETYRDALNGNLISGDGKLFSFVTAKGNKLVIDLSNLLFTGAQTPVPNASDLIIIGYVEYEDGVYLFTTSNQTDSLGDGQIVKVQIDQITLASAATLLYHHPEFNFSTKDPIGNRAIYVFESETIKRIYWTDNRNNPRSVNTESNNLFSFDPALFDFIPKVNGASLSILSTEEYGTQLTGQLRSGTYRYVYRYKSTKANIQTNWSSLSNPVFINPQTANNVSNGNVNYSTYRYYKDYQGGLQNTPPALPEVTGKAVQLSVDGIDQIYDRIVIAVQFFDGTDYNPDFTIVKEEDITSTKMYFKHTGEESLGTITSIAIGITNADISKAKTISTNKNRLVLGNITESTALDLKDITSGITIETGMYTSITDTQRQEGIVDEIDGVTGYGDYPNTWGEAATRVTSPLPSSSIFLRGNSANNSGPTGRQRGLFGHPAYQEGGIDLDDIKPGQWYGVKDSTAVIVYGGVTYTGGKYFQGEKGNESYTITSSSHSRPVGAYIRIKKFRTSAGIDIYDNHLIRGEFSDNKGPVHNHYLKGYWRGETYRFGLVVWDKKMQPTFVEWIKDIKMPEQYEEVDGQISPFLDSLASGGKDSYRADLVEKVEGDNYLDVPGMQNSIKKPGARAPHGNSGVPTLSDPQGKNYDVLIKTLGTIVDNIDLGKIVTQLGITDAELPEYISGFSIVRAPRDESIICQGVTQRTHKAVNESLINTWKKTGDTVSDPGIFKDSVFPMPVSGYQAYRWYTGHSYADHEPQYYLNRSIVKFMSPDDLSDYQGTDGVNTTRTLLDDSGLVLERVNSASGAVYDQRDLEDCLYRIHTSFNTETTGVPASTGFSGNSYGGVHYLFPGQGTLQPVVGPSSGLTGGPVAPISSQYYFLKKENYGDSYPIGKATLIGTTEAPHTDWNSNNLTQQFINMSITPTYPGFGYPGTGGNFPMKNGQWENGNGMQLSYGCAGRLIQLNSELPEIKESGTSGTYDIGTFFLNDAYTVSNIKREKTSFYGGTGDSAIASTNYISTGHFQPINSDVYTENNDSWKFDGIEVFGGDCNIGFFDVMETIGNTSNYKLTTAPTANQLERYNYYSNTIVVPLESNINYGLMQGRRPAKDLMDDCIPTTNLAFIDHGTGVDYLNTNGISNIKPENFVYNESYSNNIQNVVYPAKPLDFIAKERFINRVRYSLLKIANEPLDNFREFLIDNLKDVDIQNGEINNLSVRGENLFYWQERSVGYLPMNERVTVSTSLGEPTEIGIGGVMTRYDERTDFYGNQHAHGLIETPDGFIWIDRNNRALLNMNLGGQVAELSAMKGMMTFLDPLINNATLDNPIDKDTNGFTGIYDARTKNTYITFVGSKNTTLSGTVYNLGGTSYAMLFSGYVLFPFSVGDAITITEGNNTYNTTISTVQIVPAGILITTPIGFTAANSTIVTIVGYGTMDNQTISFNHLNSQFVSRYSFKPCLYARFKDLMFSVPNNDQGNRKELYIHDEEDLAKFYGSVYDANITLIVNPNIDIPKVFDNIESNIGSNGPSSVEYSTSFQSVTDLDIPNNKEYKFRNRDWIGTIARDGTSRMRDHYLEIKFIKDNKLNGSSTTSSNKEIKLVSLKTTFRPTY